MKRRSLQEIFVQVAGAGLLMLPAANLMATVYTVTDGSNGGVGTLRQAILDANVNFGVDTIIFDVGVTTVTLTGDLPGVTEAAIIDGSTNGGLVVVDGGGVANSLIRLDDHNSEVYGLHVINGLSYGIIVLGDDCIIGAAGKGNVVSACAHGIAKVDAGAVTIEHNYIGTDTTGTTAEANVGQGIILQSATGTVTNNVVSGNGGYGIHLNGAAAGTTIQGNIIGLNAAGTGALGNALSGIYCTSSPGISILDNTVSSNGLTGAGSNRYGIRLDDSPSAIIRGNKVGTDSAGTTGFGNGRHGISIVTAPATIGGTGAGQGNLVMGNGEIGIEQNVTSDGGTIINNIIGGNGNNGITLAGNGAVTIQGNQIGLNEAGTAAYPNTNGISVGGSGIHLIGGTTAAERNVISGNSSYGIHVTTGNTTTVRGNYIGTDITGLLDVGNAFHGIVVGGGVTGITIRDNVISGNNGDGIACAGDNADIHGNLVGLGADGDTPLGNTLDGIDIESSADSADVGSANAADRNVLAGNNPQIRLAGINMTVRGNYIGTDDTGMLDRSPTSGHGIFVSNAASGTIRDNVIAGNNSDGLNSDADNMGIHGNFIGFGADGVTSLPNNQRGVYFTSQANGNTVGSSNASDRNLIGNHGSEGVRVAGTGNTIEGNYIGVDITGLLDKGNDTGILVQAASTTVRGNVISGSGGDGINVSAAGVVIEGNIIGLGADGTTQVTNSTDGIDLTAAGTGATIGGSTAAQRNIISGNGARGINGGGGTLTVRGNYIGLAADGSTARGNTLYGVSASGDDALIRDNVVSDNGWSGIFIGGDNAQVHGNIAGLDATGAAARPNSFHGIETATGADGAVIGTADSADRNILAGNTFSGLVISGSNGTATGNYIGTDSTGLIDRGNGALGVVISTNGSGTTLTGNVVSGNGTDGIIVQAAGAVIEGNTIGLGSDGSTVIANTGDGIEVTATGTGATIGGATAPDGNIIARNGGHGINAVGSDATITFNTFQHQTLDHILLGAGTGTAIGRNSFDGNCRFPISFLGAVVANDALDADSGPNNRQNHPGVSVTEASSTTISGTLASAADTLYTIHLFSSAAAHSSTYGPGETWIGSTTATTNASGDATWSLSAGPFAEGSVLTALATAPTGDTSHFSPALAVAPAEAPTSLAATGDNTQVAGQITGTYTADDGTGTGLSEVNLWVKQPSGIWTSTMLLGGGTFAFTPSAGDGEYRFATVATDNANNDEAAPTGSDPGDIAILWNDVANSTYSHAAIADGSYLFPMTADLDVQITFAGGATGGPITVSRTPGDNSPAAGYDADRLIDEYLAINGNFAGGTATIAWNFDPTSDDSLTGLLDTVFQFDGGTLTDTYTVSPTGNTLTIGPVAGFSDWYAGSNNATASEWQLLHD